MFNRMSGGETDAEDSGHVWQHLSQPCETAVRNGRNSSLLSRGLTANCLCILHPACHTASWYLNPKNVEGGSGGIYAISPRSNQGGGAPSWRA